MDAMTLSRLVPGLFIFRRTGGFSFGFGPSVYNQFYVIFSEVWIRVTFRVLGRDIFRFYRHRLESERRRQVKERRRHPEFALEVSDWIRRHLGKDTISSDEEKELVALYVKNKHIVHSDPNWKRFMIRHAKDIA